MKSHDHVKIEITPEIIPTEQLSELEKKLKNGDDFPKNLNAYIQYAHEVHLEKIAYPIAIKKFLQYKPTVVTPTSLECFYKLSQLFFSIYQQNKNFNCLWLSHALAQHCDLNGYTFLDDKFFENIKLAFNECERAKQNHPQLSSILQFKNEKTHLLSKSFFKAYSYSTHATYNSTSDFEKLPREIIIFIFSFLKYENLVTISATNRRFNELAKTEILWTMIERNYFLKEMDYINHCRAKAENNNFLVSARNRVIDFFVNKNFSPYDVEKKLEEKLDKHPSVKKIYKEVPNAIILFIVLLGLGTGVTGAYFNVQHQSEMDRDLFGLIFTALISFAMAGLGGCAGGGCAVAILALLLCGFCKLGAFGIDKTVDHINAASLKRHGIPNTSPRHQSIFYAIEDIPAGNSIQEENVAGSKNRVK